MNEAMTFDDVLIVPKFSKIASRKDVNVNTMLGNDLISLPIMSANMDTVTGVEMAKVMIGHGAQSCLHRFCTIEENVENFKKSITAYDGSFITKPAVSIGLGDLEIERAEALKAAGAHVFIIDVAHGAQIEVVGQANRLRGMLGSYGHIIVGNFASGDSVKQFIEHVGTGVDGFKVGIGPGSSCTTRIKTGVGYPQLSAIKDIANTLKNTNLMVIADGGMRTPGDIAKALGAGAHMVMLGGMLAGTDESPGEIVDMDTGQSIVGYQHEFALGKLGKKFRGSASKESYSIQGKDASWRTAEGESFIVPYKGSVRDILQDIEGGLRSAMSYVGARNIREFQAKCEFVRITNAGYAEGLPHGKK